MITLFNFGVDFLLKQVYINFISTVEYGGLFDLIIGQEEFYIDILFLRRPVLWVFKKLGIIKE